MCTLFYADNPTASESETSSPSIMSDQQGSDSKWNKVRKEVTCVLCHELLHNPKSMPCLHTYCKKCLMEEIAKQPHDPDFPKTDYQQ